LPAIFTDRRGGSSLAPYESFNLALHVGDDLEVVAENRAELSVIAGNVQFMNQVHGDSFIVVEKFSMIFFSPKAKLIFSAFTTSLPLRLAS
jgi:copper oxidase (laccase) domain-containing protein